MSPKNKPFVLLVPALASIGLLFFGGIIHGFIQSFGLAPLVGESEFTFRFYIDRLGSIDFWRSFSLTLRVASLSTFFSALFAIFVLYCLFLVRIKSKKDRSVYIQRIFQIPMLFPYIVAAYMIFLMFVQSGWIARILFRAGIISEMSNFPVMTNESFGWGIIMAYVWKTSPFLVLLLYPVILRIEYSWVETARVLGANRFRTFTEIVLPLLLAPLETGCFIIFAYTFGAYEVPFILGVTYPEVLSVSSYETYSSGDLALQPSAMAINILILLTILITGFLYSFIKKQEPWKKVTK